MFVRVRACVCLRVCVFLRVAVAVFVWMGGGGSDVWGIKCVSECVFLCFSYFLL